MPKSLWTNSAQLVEIIGKTIFYDVHRYLTMTANFLFMSQIDTDWYSSSDQWQTLHPPCGTYKPWQVSVTFILHALLNKADTLFDKFHWLSFICYIWHSVPIFTFIFNATVQTIPESTKTILQLSQIDSHTN